LHDRRRSLTVARVTVRRAVHQMVDVVLVAHLANAGV
jgi:hypothetical protein